jgi:predicted Rossmann fold nucleotide-binding protein DprA/Smf involved in DNA uptake
MSLDTESHEWRVFPRPSKLKTGIADYGCQVLIQSDENYPASLREIDDPPLVPQVTI